MALQFGQPSLKIQFKCCCLTNKVFFNIYKEEGNLKYFLSGNKYCFINKKRSWNTSMGTECVVLGLGKLIKAAVSVI